MKTIVIKVFPGSSRNLIKEEGENFRIYLTATAVDGKANKALIQVLSRYFHVKKSQIEIIKGLKSRNKIVNIEGI